MIYHYCRVSSKDQNLARQIDALNAYKPADRVFCDKQSGKDFNRDEYQEMKQIATCGDEIIVEELDRLGRNKEEVKKELAYFDQIGVKVRMLDVPTTLNDFPGQEWVQSMLNNVLIEVLGAIAEQERKKIRKRQEEGIAIAKAEGKYTGRKPKAIDEALMDGVYSAWQRGEITGGEAAERLGISRNTLYRRVKMLCK